MKRREGALIVTVFMFALSSCATPPMKAVAYVAPTATVDADARLTDLAATLRKGTEASAPGLVLQVPEGWLVATAPSDPSAGAVAGKIVIVSEGKAPHRTVMIEPGFTLKALFDSAACASLSRDLGATENTFTETEGTLECSFSKRGGVAQVIRRWPGTLATDLKCTGMTRSECEAVAHALRPVADVDAKIDGVVVVIPAGFSRLGPSSMARQHNADLFLIGRADADDRAPLVTVKVASDVDALESLAACKSFARVAREHGFKGKGPAILDEARRTCRYGSGDALEILVRSDARTALVSCTRAEHACEEIVAGLTTTGEGALTPAHVSRRR